MFFMTGVRWPRGLMRDVRSLPKSGSRWFPAMIRCRIGSRSYKVSSDEWSDVVLPEVHMTSGRRQPKNRRRSSSHGQKLTHVTSYDPYTCLAMTRITPPGKSSRQWFEDRATRGACEEPLG